MLKEALTCSWMQIAVLKRHQESPLHANNDLAHRGRFRGENNPRRRLLVALLELSRFWGLPALLQQLLPFRLQRLVGGLGGHCESTKAEKIFPQLQACTCSLLHFWATTP